MKSSPGNDAMDPRQEFASALTRRHLFGRTATGIGLAALSTLLNSDGARAADTLPHFAPKAKRVIYLFQSGAPSQMDLFDPKPNLEKFRAQDLPESVRRGQRLTGMTSGQKTFPVAPSVFKFARHGAAGNWLSELLPHTAKVV